MTHAPAYSPSWASLSRAKLPEIFRWAEAQPWCQAMAACQQDARWHAEGDVWTHTKLVCEQLQQLDQWEALTADDQTTLTFVALFHDVAKPQTTEVDPATGHVASPKHAVKGEYIARNVLRELGCDLRTRETIARLVRYHGRPTFLLDKDSPTHEVVKLSCLVNNRLLYLFALADTRGRDTDSLSRPEENLHYWKLIAEEAECFTHPFAFANDHARFLFYRQPQADLHYAPYEEFSCTVTMLAGLPGSGKDTWLRQQMATSGDELPVVSLDDIRQQLNVDPAKNQGVVAQAARDRCRELLRNKQDFAFNATNTNRQTRQRWIDLFDDYGARIEIVYIEPPLAQILRQNASRPNPVPERIIHKLADRCDVPNWTECHCLTLVTQN